MKSFQRLLSRCLVVLTISSVPLGYATAQDSEHVREAIRLVGEAQNKVAAADWQGASQQLDQADAACGQVLLAAYDCTPLAAFARGYFWQQKATTLKGDERTAWLEQSQGAYQSVVKVSPRNAAALNNLALVESALFAATKDPTKRDALIESVRSHWQSAIDADPRQASKYAVDLGDFLLRAGRGPDAIKIYRDAAARTESELPRQRIIDHSDLINPRELLPLCNQWKLRQPDLATNCFASALRRSAKIDSDLAGDAFAGWLYVEAHTDQLTKEALLDIGRVWSDPIVGDVQNYWNNPLDGFHATSYWSGKPQRSGSIAELGAKACKKIQLSAPQDPTKPIACLERFLQSQPEMLERIVESFHGDAVDDEIGSALSVYRELLALYASNPTETTRQRSEQLINRIFEGKAQFILHRYWRVTRDFHAALAEIYLARGILNGPGATNALYQLRAVIDDGKKLVDETHGTLVNSQPDIQRLLAETSLRAADKAIETDRPRLARGAAEAYFEAAKAYLDYDAFDSAKQMLEFYNKLDGSALQAAQLKQILASRQAVSSFSASGLNQTKMPWLFQASPQIPIEFLARQRFKLLGDKVLATKPGDPERLDSALGCYEQSVKERVVLLGTADVVRWQNAEQELLASTNVSVHPPVVSYQQGSAPQSVVAVNLAGDRNAGYITPATQTPKTAEVVRQVGARDMLRVRKYFYNGVVVGEHGTADPSLKKAMQVLGNQIPT